MCQSPSLIHSLIHSFTCPDFPKPGPAFMDGWLPAGTSKSVNTGDLPGRSIFWAQVQGLEVELFTFDPKLVLSKKGAEIDAKTANSWIQVLADMLKMITIASKQENKVHV